MPARPPRHPRPERSHVAAPPTGRHRFVVARYAGDPDATIIEIDLLSARLIVINADDDTAAINWFESQPVYVGDGEAAP